MKVVIQRVNCASVKVEDKVVGSIDQGLMLLVAFNSLDDREKLDYMVDKIINLRIFDDEDGIMNKSLIDVNGSILSVSQFTLYGNTSKGRRPSYIESLNGKDASILYDEFNQKLQLKNINTEMGIFGSDMLVSIENDGPVTLIIER